MSLFRAGPNKSSNVYLGLVTVLMHFDRQQRFPWSDYVDVLIKAVMFELTVESSASSPPYLLDPSSHLVAGVAAAGDLFLRSARERDPLRFASCDSERLRLR